MEIKINWTGWLGYFLFAGVGSLFFIYYFLPSVGGIGGCVTAFPLYCLSIYGLFHVPFGVAGFFVVSHMIGHRNVKIALFVLTIVLGSFLGGLSGGGLAHAQPVPVFANVVDYRPYIYYPTADNPFNISYATASLDEYYVFEWLFYWNYHPVSAPSTCAAAIPTEDFEPVYIYVSVLTQQVAGIAYRFHCQWTFLYSQIVLISLPGVYSINATRPVITFVSKYHVPNNGYPGNPIVPWGTTYTEFQGSYTYVNNDNYNYTQVPMLSPNAGTIDPGFFRGINWPNVELLTAVGFVVTGSFTVAFAFERKKLAGPLVK